MASFILKGLVTNDSIDRLKMASTIYENGIDRLRNWHRPFTKGKSATATRKEPGTVTVGILR